jgi:hypothetical protein
VTRHLHWIGQLFNPSLPSDMLNAHERKSIQVPCNPGGIVLAVCLRNSLTIETPLFFCQFGTQALTFCQTLTYIVVLRAFAEAFAEAFTRSPFQTRRRHPALPLFR